MASFRPCQVDREKKRQNEPSDRASEPKIQNDMSQIRDVIKRDVDRKFAEVIIIHTYIYV